VDFFPDDVRRFIDGWIESVDQLEILRLLSDRPGTLWDAETVARELTTDAATAGAELRTLHGRGLLRSERRGADAVYGYAPSPADVAAKATRVLDFYRERPVSVIKAVYARPKDSIRTLADAFRVRKEG
jgi:hypothetical protein